MMTSGVPSRLPPVPLPERASSSVLTESQLQGIRPEEVISFAERARQIHRENVRDRDEQLAQLVATIEERIAAVETVTTNAMPFDILMVQIGATAQADFENPQRTADDELAPAGANPPDEPHAMESVSYTHLTLPTILLV